MNEDMPIIFSGKPRKNMFLRYVLIGAFCVLFLTAGILNEIYIPHPRFTGSQSVDIPAGFGSRMIADKLKHEGFIRSKWIFELYVTLRGEASLLKPGQYEFENASIKIIAQTLVKGSRHENAITVPEGSTVQDLGRILANQGLKTASFESFANSHTFPTLESAFPFLKEGIPISGLEGYLFPDTYHIFTNATNEQIAVIFLQNFDKKVTPELRHALQKNKKTLRDIIIMASMIEREVTSDHDRAIVSGILWKRITLGIPLQVDATVLYAKKQRATNDSKQSALTLDDLAIDSRYNTYKYRGLPLGPIGNPGLSAIQAAVYPAASPYLYYLSAPDGRTIFSRTLEEHNIAKRKYLTK